MKNLGVPRKRRIFVKRVNNNIFHEFKKNLSTKSIIYKCTFRQIYTGKENPNQTNREVNLHGKFNICQPLLIRDRKITSLLFCPNALFFYFGSFGLMAPEHWSLFLSQVP